MKRYTIGQAFSCGHSDMDEDLEGDWVRHEDAEKMRKALEQIILESTKLEVYSIALQALEGDNE